MFKFIKNYMCFMMFAQILAIYTVFYKESESEVKKCQTLEPGGKNKKSKHKIEIVYFIWGCPFIGKPTKIYQKITQNRKSP